MRIEKINNRIHVIADEGMLCTNGKDVYGADIALAEGLASEEFYQITYEEYEQILAAQESTREFE